ncbi:MAG: hypothetical protein IPL27_23085 [Lewinellaceae bacterium]|nr:hypothetical protein [Lewinellaceae bacterium]
MQLVIDIKHEQDPKAVPLLERLKIAYTSCLKTKCPRQNPAGLLSDKYAGKLSKKAGESLQQHITESRREWERNTPNSH